MESNVDEILEKYRDRWKIEETVLLVLGKLIESG